MNIGIVSDHRGFNLKREIIIYLQEKGYNIIDYGTLSLVSVDYPDYAIKIGKKIIKKEVSLGIAVCGTGIGMSIACNKVKGIRCAKVDNIEEAKLAREHNNANVIALSSKKTLDELQKLIFTFLETNFSNIDRHLKRIEKIKNYEEGKNTNEY